MSEKRQTARQGGERAVTQIRGQGVINHCRDGLPQATKVLPVRHFAQQECEFLTFIKFYNQKENGS